MLILPFRPDASWRHRPIGTIAVMSALALIHLVWGQGDPDALHPYLLDFQTIAPLQWLTSAVLHADWLHLGGNLLFLFVFGAIVEDFLGGWFVPAYLLLALASSALEQCLGLLSQRQGFALGASSTIYALVALAMLWAPQTRVSTFIWVLLTRPRVVEIRVVWLAGSFMAMEILSVWLQGGHLSSQFLHACGIAVGLPFGLLALRERWVDTGGDDLLSSGVRPAPAGAEAGTGAAPASVTWEQQVARLESAIHARDRRLALAAYEVLRREHPTRLPDPAAIEWLVATCEDGLDFHRAAAVAGRAVSAGQADDGLLLRLARIHGQHLGDAETGRSLLERIGRERLDADGQAEYERLHLRFGRRQPSAPQTRRLRSSALLLLLACLPLAAAEPVQFTQAEREARREFFTRRPDPEAAQDRPPVLEAVEPALVTGRVEIAGGAALILPDGFAYMPWSEAQRFFIISAAIAPEETPIGLVLADEQIEQLISERSLVRSRDEWERKTIDVLTQEGPVQLFWEEGWIDTAEGLPAAEDLLSALEAHAKIMNRQHVFGPGITLSIDGWGRQPSFDAAKGILQWSLQTRWQGRPFSLATVSVFSSICHLGARGTLRLLCNGGFDNPQVAEHLQQVSSAVRWDRSAGFATQQPDQVGELAGGLRRLILPRLVFGNPEDDTLVFRGHGGMGYAWILIVIPVLAMAIVLVRRARNARPPATTAAPGPGTPGRCPACGTPLPSNPVRCFSCGQSLAR